MNPHLQATDNEPDWDRIRPILDEAMHEIKEDDRDAILLRYFEKLSLGEVGTRLGITENTARMRIERAMEKLRARLAACGISSTAAALGVALAQQAVHPAPGALWAGVVGHARASRASRCVTRHPGWSNSDLRAGKAALVIGVAFMLVIGGLWKGRSPATDPTESPRIPGDQTAALGGNASTALTHRIKADKAPKARLALFFVDDRTGRPVTNRVASLRGWERGSQLLVEKILPLDGGRCTSPFDPEFGPAYWILSCVEGYADAMLEWQPRRGDVIPDVYSLRLVQPALIRGRVLDPSGKAVAGAEVAFGNNPIPSNGASPESRQISHLTVLSDAEGRWEINRIAPEVVRYLVGSASHPGFAQSEHVDVTLQPEAAQQLLEGAFVFQLGAGAVVTGAVVDTTGRPVDNALVHVGMLSETGSRDTRTDEHGAFRVIGCRTGTQWVTGSADGFAPAVLSLNLDTNPSPVKLVLGAGRTLRVRTVDLHDTPVVGARLWYRTFSQKISAPFPQVEFTGKSDDDGQIIWAHAPDLAMQFDCSAPGHMRVDDFILQSGDQEQVVTLPQALVIRGSVRDAASGELLPRFRLGIGWPEAGPDGSVQPKWFGTDRFWLSFTGGEFEHSLEEPVVSGMTNPGYIFRFEAEGHAPFVTRPHRPDEGEVSMDIRLEKGTETLIIVYTPEGRVAADAQIGLLAPGNRLRLVPGGFSTSSSEGSTWLRKADAQGQFVLPTDETVKSVAIAHPKGFLECTPAELRKTRAVRLQPWARLEGVWPLGERSTARREITLRYSSNPDRPLEMEPSAFSTTADDNGRFVFAQVPAGMLEIMTWQDTAEGNWIRFGASACQIQALAGRTSQVRLASEGGKER